MSIVIVAIRMLYNINCFCMWERSLGGLVSEEPDDDEVDAELPDVTKTTEDLPKNLEMKYYEPNAETTFRISLNTFCRNLNIL